MPSKAWHHKDKQSYSHATSEKPRRGRRPWDEYAAFYHPHKNSAMERAVHLSKSTKFRMRYAERCSNCTSMSVPFCILSNATARYAGEGAAQGQAR